MTVPQHQMLSGRDLVFLGPSLSLPEAVVLHPEAVIRPPIKFGDLYAVLACPPARVLIIDGFFHAQTPIWQREILSALHAGIELFGASSMGALRALELAPYGMVGLGEVFRLFDSGEIEGDDEVALSHGPAEIGYVELSVPLVDLRWVLGEIFGNEPHARDLIAQVKSWGHVNRTVERIVAAADRLGLNGAELRQSLAGRTRLKTLDARAALTLLADSGPAGVNKTDLWMIPDPAPLDVEPRLSRLVNGADGRPLSLRAQLQARAEQPGALSDAWRLSRRHWFLQDWCALTGQGPNEAEVSRFAGQAVSEYAKAGGQTQESWLALHGLRPEEMPSVFQGSATSDWIARRPLSNLNLISQFGPEVPPEMAVLLDWAARSGAVPPGDTANEVHATAVWLVQQGPLFFGAVEWHEDVALLDTSIAENQLFARAGS
ncbi:TfuA-like protein [uncultured Ruegeria sp.]|uniref:TfuA-like protein n=1 Tax=uncultured Ruegeria sp. TaxID=259304 RepID=UPI00262C3E40|nr:TfuA-like protein [uncultured Ruegeria sp.]